jgi:4-hydroxybenzoyl-CoA thioesterase
VKVPDQRIIERGRAAWRGASRPWPGSTTWKWGLSVSRVWAFERELQVRFSHCDPAGIIFFPQYLVMFVDLVEDWFTNGLGVPYSEMIMRSRVGVPTVQLNCRFAAPSTMGDRITLGLSISKLRSRSFTLALGCRAGEQMRVEAEQVLVTTSLETHKAIAIPDHIRSAMLAFQHRPVTEPEGDTDEHPAT